MSCLFGTEEPTNRTDYHRQSHPNPTPLPPPKNSGAAVATGDGEEIMRVCLSFLVVEQLRMGVPVSEACRRGIKRLKECFAQSHSAASFSSTFSLGVYR